VTVLARGERATQIENGGICVTGLSQFTQPVRVVRNPADLRSEVLVVAIKGPDVRAILKSIPAEPISTALSIQNGLEKNDLLIDAFGSHRVLGALANASGEMFADGKVAFISVNSTAPRPGGWHKSLRRSMVLAFGHRRAARFFPSNGPSSRLGPA